VRFGRVEGLRPNLEHRVEGVERSLEDHRTIAPAELAQFARLELEHIHLASVTAIGDDAGQFSAVSGSSRTIASPSVDLPEPLSPISARLSPACRSSVTPRTPRTFETAPRRCRRRVTPLSGVLLMRRALRQ
jgi:hypothetical protein